MRRLRRSDSASRIPKASGTQQNLNIPVLFRSQAPGIYAPSQASSLGSLGNESEAALGQGNPAYVLPPPLIQPPSLLDLQKVASDIKSTLTAEITDLKVDIQAVTTRIDNVEHMAQLHSDAQLSHFLDIQRHIEDLDNRGRRHNIRVRGIPESVESEAIQPVLSTIFKDLLNRPHDSPTEMEGTHSCVPGLETPNPHRDTICCLVNFALKGEIMRKARDRGHVMYNGMEIKLFQDLSQLTFTKQMRAAPPAGHSQITGHYIPMEVPILLISYLQGTQGTAMSPRKHLSLL